jgi:hypothetical protein
VPEATLRRAAFGDLSGPSFTGLATGGEPRTRLLTAVLLGAKGRYAAAATILDELRRDDDPVLASLAGSTLASHRRQLGGHGAARGLDGVALLAATRASVARQDPDGLDARGALSDALLGLAADNLAVGQVAVARRLAATAAGVPAGWRGQVRAGWVGAEIELAAGRAVDAVGPAERAAELAHARGARRHAIKSDLVLGAALAATGVPASRDRAAELVRSALSAAEKCEFLSLIWPACLIGAELSPEVGLHYRFRARQVLHAVLLHADPCVRRLAKESPWVPT